MIGKNRILSIFMVGMTALTYTNQAKSETNFNKKSFILEPDYTEIFRNFGPGFCEAGYRPISIKEARENQKMLLDKMKRWDVISLENGWIIKGSGFKDNADRFQRDNTLNITGTACYIDNRISPTKALESIFTTFPPLIIDGGSAEKVEWRLFSDVENFIRPVSLLGYTLGFNMLAGNQGVNVGDDMDIWREQTGIWKIRGNESGNCYPSRCDKTTISVKDIRYVLDPNSFITTGPIIENNKTKISTIVVPLTNTLNTPQNLVIDLSYDITTSWSHTTNDSISWKIGFGSSITSTTTWSNSVEVSIPGLGGGDSSFQQSIALSFNWNTEVGGNNSWGSTTGGSETKRVTVQARPILEPNSSAIAILELYRADISFPYQAFANISYELEFDGKIRNWGNPTFSNTQLPSHMKKSFLIGRSSQDNDKNLEYLYDHRDIPGINSIWDWNKMIGMYGIDTLKNRIGKALQSKQTTIKGIIHHSDTFAGSISLLEQESIYKLPKSDIIKMENLSDIEYNIRQQLELIGLENIEVSVREADKVSVD